MKPKKYLGQHFLKDERIIKKILDFADINEKDLVVEIGPGKGALTKYLSNYTPYIVLIEKDKDLIPFLKENFKNVLIKFEDARFLDLKKILDEANKFYGKNFKKLKIISNLPYNVANIILINLLNYLPLLQDLTLMIQKEVFERIVATPKDKKKYGFLSILFQTFFDIKKGFEVSPKSFFPPPKVYSVVFKLIPKDMNDKDICYFYKNLESYKNFLTKAFSQRRKKLKNVYPEFPKEFLEKRAEELSVEDYKNTFKLLFKKNWGEIKKN